MATSVHRPARLAKLEYTESAFAFGEGSAAPWPREKEAAFALRSDRPATVFAHRRGWQHHRRRGARPYRAGLRQPAGARHGTGARRAAADARAARRAADAGR